MTVFCFLLSLYYAWRYSKAEIDPDWAMFNLRSFTGAIYGKDFVDCKSPAIHLWYWMLAKIAGRNIRRIRFLHHVLVSLPGLLIGGWAGLAFVVLVNSGWLLAFHGNVGQIPAGLLLLALWLADPWFSTALVFLAIANEPKLIFSGVALIVISGWYVPGLAFFQVAMVFALSLRFFFPDVWGWLWEANITLPKRMVQRRQRDPLPFTPWFVAHTYIYTLPWLGMGFVAKPDVLYWLPVVLFLAVSHAGILVRANHLIPIIPWIVLAGIPAPLIIVLALSDFLSGGLYLGDIWHRFYIGLRQINVEAREIGNWLKGRTGTLWVNSYHTAINIYSGKPPVYGMNEQAEIREAAHERRAIWRDKMKHGMPEYVVQSEQGGWKFQPIGYQPVAQSVSMVVYKKV